MQIKPETKLIELAMAYPWLPAYAKTLDSRLAVLETPLGRMLMRRTTVAQAAELAGMPLKSLLERLDQAISEHG